MSSTASWCEPIRTSETALVHKRRAHYLLDDCMVELTELSADGSTTRTIAVESPDPALVSATVSTLGLDGRRNVSFARGVKALLGFGAQRYAVIDVGTNSVKFHLGERQADGEPRTVVDRAEITRLGEGLAESGRLTERRDAPDARGHRRDGRRSLAERRRRHRGRRHRRAAPSAQQRRAHRCGEDPVRDRHRGHLGRGRSSTRVPRGHLGPSGRQRAAGRVRLRRWQHAVHLRARRSGRRAVQRRRGRRSHR